MAIAANHYFAGSCLPNAEIIGRVVAGEYLPISLVTASGTWGEIREVRYSDTTDPDDFLTVDVVIRDLSSNVQTGSRAQYTRSTSCTSDDHFGIDDVPVVAGALSLMFAAAFGIRILRQQIEAHYAR